MKTLSIHTGSGASRTIKGLVASLALVAGTAAHAAPIGQVGVFVSGEEFGIGKEIHAVSGAKRIATSQLYTYRLSGKIKSQSGTALGKALGSGVSLDSFLEGLKSGSSSQLGGTFTNTGGALPATLIDKTFSGTKTFPGIGPVKISFSVVGKIDANGQCSIDVTGVKTKPKLTAQQKAAFGTIKFMKGAKFLVSAAPTILFKKSNTLVAENAGTVVVPVWRDTNYHGACSVNFTTVDGTANSSHYTPTSGTLNFADGETQKNITIPITNTPTKEGVRRFTIELSNPSTGAFLGASTSTTVTITADP